ncbi:MAG TPA: nucleotidyltransferase family protein [Terracidiphilus sp.]|nr:nucleotidyltransferase family protein [Terracidiphilus sp.]
MRPSDLLPQHRDAIRRMVLQSGMANPRLFGSVVHGSDTDASDLDILVDPSPQTSLLDLAKLQSAIESTVGVKIDLRTPGFFPEPLRQKVLSEAVPV